MRNRASEITIFQVYHLKSFTLIIKHEGITPEKKITNRERKEKGREKKRGYFSVKVVSLFPSTHEKVITTFIQEFLLDLRTRVTFTKL